MKNKQIYYNRFFGDFWAPQKKDKDGKWRDGGVNYQIDVLIPTEYKTPEAAAGDLSSLRFQKIDEHVVLVVWSGWHQGFGADGKWHEHVDGKVLSIITWEEWHRYQMSVVKPEVGDFGYDAMSDYIPCATPWDELFEVETKDDSWGCTVESLAYSIVAYQATTNG